MGVDIVWGGIDPREGIWPGVLSRSARTSVICSWMIAITRFVQGLASDVVNAKLTQGQAFELAVFQP